MKKLFWIPFIFLFPILTTSGGESITSEQLKLLGIYNDLYYFLVQTNIYNTKGIKRDIDILHEYYIRTYDKGMNIKEQLQLLGMGGLSKEKTDDKKMIYQVEQVLLFNGRLILFTTGIQVLVPQTGLYMETIDPITLTCRNDRKKIMEVHSSVLIIYRPAFYFKQSEDGSKLMAFGRPSYSNKRDQSYSIMVFNKDLQPLWEKKIDLPYKDKQIDFDKPVIRDNGDVYVTCSRSYITKEERENLPDDIDYTVLFKITANGTALSEHKIDLGIKIASNSALDLSEDAIMIASLSYDFPSKSINGCYFANYNLRSDELIGHSLRYCYPGEGRVDLPEGATWTTPEKHSDKKKFFEIKGPLVLGDGDRYYWAEHTFSETLTVSMQSTLADITNIYQTNGDIIVFKVNSKGDINWISRIPIDQYINYNKGDNNDYRVFGSYYVTLAGNNIVFIGNDNPKNIPTTEGNLSKFNGKKGYMQMIVVNEDGQITKKAITMEKMVYPESCSQLSDHEWLLPVIDLSKKKSFMDLDLNNLLPKQ